MLTGTCICALDSERGRTDKKVEEREKKGCEEDWGKESEGGTKGKSEEDMNYHPQPHGMNSMLPTRTDLRACH